MPGIEVFTISGAPYLGAPGAYMPPAGSPGGALVPATPAAPAALPAVRLQNALVALGATAGGDPVLSSVKIDGVIGPATVKAVNQALATYVGASPQFPHANLDITKVRQYAGALAVLVENRVRMSGGTIPTPQVVKRAPKPALSITSAAASMINPTNIPTSTDRRWMFWAVGGVSVLVLLAAAASAVKKRRAEA